MQQNETDEGVDMRQAKALSALVAGSTVVRAAEYAGVSRATIYRWRNDPRFQHLYRTMRRENLAELDARIAGLADAAFGTLKKAIIAGDVRASLAVLRGVGALDGNPRDLS